MRKGDEKRGGWELDGGDWEFLLFFIILFIYLFIYFYFLLFLFYIFFRGDEEKKSRVKYAVKGHLFDKAVLNRFFTFLKIYYHFPTPPIPLS